MQDPVCINQLYEWVEEQGLSDEWWMCVDGEVNDDIVGVEDLWNRLNDSSASKVQAIHVAQADEGYRWPTVVLKKLPPSPPSGDAPLPPDPVQSFKESKTFQTDASLQGGSLIPPPPKPLRVRRDERCDLEVDLSIPPPPRPVRQADEVRRPVDNSIPPPPTFSEEVDRPIETTNSALIERSDEANKVGGWLLFFCVQLTIIGPIFATLFTISEFVQIDLFVSRGLIASSYRGAFEATASVMLISNLITKIWGFVIGCGIWKGGRHLLSNVKQFILWGCIIQVIASCIVFIILVSEVSGEVAIKSAARPIVSSIAYFLLWWFYFEKSKRVRNYFV